MSVTPSKRRKSGRRHKSAQGPVCPSCGEAVLSEARFCHACGAGLVGESGGRWWSGGRLAVLGAGAGLAAIAIATVIFFQRDGAPTSEVALNLPTPDFGNPPAQSSGAPPDLSQMSPREMADRLFNRVMMASEQGNRGEALRFVPMAIEAYAGLGTLDRDAHYHLGLIHAVAGDRARVERQIAALREGAPDHLLALVLEHNLARKAGDEAAVARSRAAFAAAYETEIARERPEYQAHRNAIERFRSIPASPAAVSPAPPSPGVQEGAALFAAHCAGCHGAGAAGSDQGPPLVHKIYEPSHHDDESFYRAVRQGVRAHHWSFGDMQPVPGVSDAETEKIVAYVRALQRKAGIK